MSYIPKHEEETFRFGCYGFRVCFSFFIPFISHSLLFLILFVGLLWFVDFWFNI